MIKFKSRLNLLYLLMIFIVAAAAVIKINFTPISHINDGFLSLDKDMFNDKKLIQLNGKWEQYNNKFIIPKDIQFFNSEKIFSELKNIEKNNFSTYFLEFEMEDFDTVYGIDIPPVYGSYEIYLNGEKIADNGVLNLKNELFDVNFRSKQIPLKIIGKRNSIVVYLSNNSYKIGGLKDYIKIGKYSDILEKRENKRSALYLLFGIVLVALIYKIALFYLNKERVETLYFVFSALALMLLLTLKAELNLFKSFYLNFTIELIVKLIIPILIIRLNKILFDKSKEKFNLKKLLLFLLPFLLIKKEQYIPVNILYIVINIISITMFYYIIVAVKYTGIKEKEYHFLKTIILIAVSGLIYSSVLLFYGIEFEYEIFLIAGVIIGEALLIIKNILDEYGCNVLLSKELDMNKEKLEKIVFYKGMMMEKEKLKWNNFIKHFKEIAIIVDEDGNIIECNPATMKFFEVLESDILDKKIWDLEFRYNIEEEKTLTNYHNIKKIYVDLLEDGTYFSKESCEIKEIETENKIIKKINIVRFSIPLKNGKMIGVIAREIRIQKDENINMNEKIKIETGITLFSIDDIIEIIKSNNMIKLLDEKIEIENMVKLVEKLIGNSNRIVEIIKELLIYEDELEKFIKARIKFENISEGKEYIVLSIKISIKRKEIKMNTSKNYNGKQN
jgi:hypothetical protein